MSIREDYIEIIKGNLKKKYMALRERQDVLSQLPDKEPHTSELFSVIAELQNIDYCLIVVLDDKDWLKKKYNDAHTN